MRERRPLLRVLALAAAVCVLPGIAAAEPAPESAPRLVSARFDRKKKDSLGFEWGVNDRGVVTCGSQGPFESAGQLQINDNEFYPQKRMMTADGSLYVFTSMMQIHQPGVSVRIEITRRVKIDTASGTARFVESFRNVGSGPAMLMVNLTSSLQNPPGSILTDAGAAPGVTAVPRTPAANPFEVQPAEASGATLDNKESGLVIAPAAEDSPALLLYLASAKAKVKPTFQGEGGGMACHYFVSVPPQQTASILHGVAQRKLGGKTDPRSLARLFKPFRAKSWTTDLPDDLKKSLVNFGSASSEDDDPTGPLLAAVLRRAESYGVERGSLDVLVQDESSRLAGGVRGKELTVQTRFGPATAPLAEVAMILGGAGVERPMQVHLRNGEVLAGPITWKDVGFVTEAGLEVPLAPEQLNVLFLHADPKDNVPPDGAAVLVSTHAGDRLAVASQPPTLLHASTAWGPLDVGLGDIGCLYLIRDPQPVYRLVLGGGSRLSVLLRGGEVAMPTLRFKQTKVAAASIAQVVPARPPAKTQADEADEEDEGDARGPRLVLVGENTLAGTLKAARLDILTVAGPTQIETRLIRRAELREGDDDGGEFQFVLTDGSRLVGRLRDRVLAVESQGKVWSVPVHHVLGIHQPLPPGAVSPEEKPKTDGQKPDSGKPPSEKEKPQDKPETGSGDEPERPETGSGDEPERPEPDPFQVEPKPPAPKR